MENDVLLYGTARRTAPPARRAPRTSADKALDVLFHLHQAGAPLGVSEIGRGLGQPKSSVHRLLAALARRGMVEQDERGLYRPGIAMLGLGLGVLEQEPLVAAARDALVVLDKAEGTGVLRASPRIGSLVPLHATAVGKVALAWAPSAFQPHRLERFTPHTVLSWQELLAEAERVRAQGYAVSEEEWIEGLSVVAAPVQGPRGLTGSIAIAVASARLPALGAQLLGARAVAVASEVERRLGGVP